MRPALIVGSLFLACSLLVGCGSDRYSTELKAGLKALGKMRELMKKVDDAEKITKSQAEIMTAIDEARDARKRIDAAAPSADEDRKKILKKYSPAMGSALLNNAIEVERIGKFDAGKGDTVAKAAGEVLESYKDLVIKEKEKDKSE